MGRLQPCAVARGVAQARGFVYVEGVSSWLSILLRLRAFIKMSVLRRTVLSDCPAPPPSLACLPNKVMACPSGCLNGGGQLKAQQGETPTQLLERLELTYNQVGEGRRGGGVWTRGGRRVTGTLTQSQRVIPRL